MYSSTSQRDDNLELSMSIFSDNEAPITQQPTTRDEEWLVHKARRPIPVSTIDWQSSMTSHFLPLHGLDFLQDVSQLIIQQSIELPDLMSNMESENRYAVKVPRGETIYYATEASTVFQRTCFGSGRSFSMRLYDPTQQEAIFFKRRLACGSCCSLFCYLQELEVWIPPGELIGKISQNINGNRPDFFVINKRGEVIFRIEGPEAACGCLLGKSLNFQLFSGDGSTQVGSIIHQWDQIQGDYNLNLQMPGNCQNTQNKALLLGAAFLLEYMYFESAKRTALRCIC